MKNKKKPFQLTFKVKTESNKQLAEVQSNFEKS